MVSSAANKYIDFSRFPHMWCAGCGAGIVLGSIARALSELELKKKK